MSSKSGNLVEFPNWKTFATAEERFLELAAQARRHPEQFQRMILVYQEDLPKHEGQVNAQTLTRYVLGGARDERVTTTIALGLLDLGRHEVLRYTHNY